MQALRETLFKPDVRIWVLLILLMLTFSIAKAQRFSLSPELLFKIKSKYGESAEKRLLKWQKLINESRDLPEMEKVKKVNKFFNKMKFVNDIDHWKKRDYWATPVEFLATRGGDCEDFSVAKYFTLKEIGVPANKLIMTYVKAIKLDQSHIVVSYFEDEDKEPLVLDNLIKRIKPASERRDLLPIYSFNGDKLWLSKERAKGKLLGSSDRLQTWKDLGIRMKNELNMDLMN